MGAPGESEFFREGGLGVHAEAQNCAGVWAEKWLANPKLGFAIHRVVHAQARSQYLS